MARILLGVPETARCHACMQVGGPGLAIIDLGDSGPKFGAEGLHILLTPGQERLAKSRLGSYYARRSDGGRTLFAKGEDKRAQLLDCKVPRKLCHTFRVSEVLAQRPCGWPCVQGLMVHAAGWRAAPNEVHPMHVQ